MSKRWLCHISTYDVFDMWAAGNAYAIELRAWDNWRQYAHDKVEGIPIDKRLVFLALLGDRSQIGNMTLEEFSRLTCDQVEALQDSLKPGMMLVRPSIEEAGLDESPVSTTPPQSLRYRHLRQAQYPGPRIRTLKRSKRWNLRLRWRLSKRESEGEATLDEEESSCQDRTLTSRCRPEDTSLTRSGPS